MSLDQKGGQPLKSASSSTPTPVTTDSVHISYMQTALNEAKKCEPTSTAFCVGAVIVVPSTSSSYSSSTTSDQQGDVIIVTGYSRELPGNTHAEQCAIEKFLNPALETTTPTPRSSSSPSIAALVDSDKKNLASRLRGASIYTTMEPCSERLSGNLPCVNRILSFGFSHVYLAVEEPSDFVESCQGVRRLKEAGVAVWKVESDGLEQECLQVARRGHS